MKPRVHRETWLTVGGGVTPPVAYPRWHVDFQDLCGCVEEVDFPTFEKALRFAHHIAAGGDRWGFQ